MDKFVLNKLINNFTLAASNISEKLINLKHKNNLFNIKKIILIIFVCLFAVLLYFY
jgi:hypothetical protein